jgi:hypothetical protein
MKKNYLLLLVAYMVMNLSCNNRSTYISKPFFDPYGKKVGDSVYCDNLIEKIVFTDSTYEIDSVVFSRYDNSARTIKAINTYMNGKLVFENKYFYRNGNIAVYKFIDEEKSNYFYERWYHSNGLFDQSRGYVFYQGYIIDTTPASGIKVKQGTSIAYRIYHPNPPDCVTNLYLVDGGGKKWSVFQKSKFLDFLQTVWQDNDKLGFFETTFLLELKDQHADTTITFSQNIIMEVVADSAAN